MKKGFVLLLVTLFVLSASVAYAKHPLKREYSVGNLTVTTEVQLSKYSYLKLDSDTSNFACFKCDTYEYEGHYMYFLVAPASMDGFPLSKMGKLGEYGHLDIEYFEGTAIPGRYYRFMYYTEVGHGLAYNVKFAP